MQFRDQTIPHTIRIRALVGNQILLMLIDSGSSHSFVNADLVERIKRAPMPVKTMAVIVANGELLYSDQMIPGMSWWIQGHTFRHDMRVLNLGGYDAILGADWLEQCGEMKCHWKKKWVEFEH